MEDVLTQFFGRASNTPIVTRWTEIARMFNRTIMREIMNPTQIDFTGRRILILRPKSMGEAGQASLEFILTFIFGVGLSMLFVTLAINMTKGYIVHYANFMASRAFLVHDSADFTSKDSSLQQASAKAKDVFESYPLGQFGLDPEFSVNLPMSNSNLMSGTIAKFDERMTPLRFIGGSNRATFYSESFLLKEPLRLQCMESLCNVMGMRSCQGDMYVTLFDNGC